MWLTEHRRARQMSIAQLAHKVDRISWANRRRHVDVRRVIYMLETVDGFLTIPTFADLIAEACGATPQQRDSLTLPKYRTTAEPPPEAAPPAKPAPLNPSQRRHACVAIDREGRVVRMFDSVAAAAEYYGVTRDVVYRRCMQRTGYNDYAYGDITWRYADGQNKG